MKIVQFLLENAVDVIPCIMLTTSVHLWKIEGNFLRVYLNTARYLKVGQNTWMDRSFSHAVVSGVYHFHASVASYAEYWNDQIWKQHPEGIGKLSQRQIWQTFVQESIRSITGSSGVDLELEDDITLVTKQVFSILDDRGIIRAVDNHHCSECTQTYKSQADSFSLFDSAATVGVDENAFQILYQFNLLLQFKTDANADVRMVVVDSIVIGPNVCFLYHIIH